MNPNLFQSFLERQAIIAPKWQQFHAILDSSQLILYSDHGILQSTIARIQQYCLEYVQLVIDIHGSM